MKQWKIGPYFVNQTKMRTSATMQMQEFRQPGIRLLSSKNYLIEKKQRKTCHIRNHPYLCLQVRLKTKPASITSFLPLYLLFFDNLRTRPFFEPDVPATI